ncbi:MAG: ABC transporter permease subunit [Thermoclostridium sp.]|nr:ABC transporter permease subunit [Thermoclostridium sp.]
MRKRYSRAAVLLLALLTIVSLLAGCSSNTKPTVTEASQMNNTAFTIGVPTGATAVNAVQSALPKAKMKHYTSLPDAYLAVQQGKVDAFAYDRYLLGFAIANGLDGVRILPDNIGKSDDVAIGISRKAGIPNLEQKINDILAALAADGTLDDMFTRWVVNADDTMPDIPKPVQPAITLKVGTSGLVQPFSYYQGNSLTGYDLELSARIALALNAELDIRVYDYDGFPSAAEAGTIDCILANLNATTERRETMDFSTPLFQSQTALLVKDATGASSGGHLTDNARVAVETSRLGVMDGSTNTVYAAEHYPDADIQSFKNYVDSTAALDSGKLDYAMMDYTSALRFIRSNKNLEIVSDALTDERVCLGINNKQPELAQKVSAIVDRYLSDGTMDEIISHWIKPDASDYDVVKTPRLPDAPAIKVAIIASREPTTFMMDSQYMGMDIELIDRVLYELGYQAEYIDMDLAGILASVESNKADMTMGMYSTPERAERLLFTAPYFANPQVLLAKKLTGTQQTTATDADTQTLEYTKLSQLEGKKLATMTGTVFDQLVGAVIPNTTYLYFNDIADMLPALRSGKVDGVTADEPVAKYMAALNPDVAILPEYVMHDRYGVALAKDSPLTADFTRELEMLAADGTRDKVFAKWSGTNIEAKTLPSLDYPASNGTLRVACAVGSEPMVYSGSDGKPLGFEVEMVVRVAQSLGMKVELMPVSFDAMLSMLQSGKADVAMGSMSITDERKKVVDMVEDYTGGIVILVRKSQASAAEQPGGDFWNGLKASFTRTFIKENRWMLVLDGLEVTVLISICSGILGSLFGFVICMLRRSKKRIASLPAAGFIRLIQGTPIVVLLMILYYIIFGKVDVPAVLVAIFGFALNFGVYVSEMMRTGIDAVDKGQIEAAYAIGFTRTQTFRKITFPQAARHFLPVFKGEFISMVKMTSVVGYIAIQDLTKVSDIIRSRTLEAFFPLIATAVIYFLVANVLTLLLSRLEISLDPKRRKRTVKGVMLK